MMTKNADEKREQMLMFCMDDMVPQNHMLRLIDKAIDLSFIYELVEEKYRPDNGRPSMDPVMLIKIPLIQYLYGIRSMLQTIKEIEVKIAHELLEDGIEPLFPYKRPMTKEGFFLNMSMYTMNIRLLHLSGKSYLIL